MKTVTGRAAKKAVRTALRKDANKALKKQIKRRVRHKVCHKLGRIGGKLTLFTLIAFVVTFGIYMFNLENKLIYYGVYPLLQKIYNKQSRDRKI